MGQRSPNGADVNAQGGRYGDALQAASYEDDEKMVQLLLSRNAKEQQLLPLTAAMSPHFVSDSSNGKRLANQQPSVEMPMKNLKVEASYHIQSRDMVLPWRSQSTASGHHTGAYAFCPSKKLPYVLAT
ncbi:fibronectin type 3 and ankyrin repeat domain protein 1 [Apiospora saccharicola]